MHYCISKIRFKLGKPLKTPQRNKPVHGSNTQVFFSQFTPVKVHQSPANLLCFVEISVILLL